MVSGETLCKDAIAEVYVLAAMTIRFYLPSRLHFLAVSFILIIFIIYISMVSGETLCKDAVAEVYVLAAMTIRFYLPSRLHFLAVSFI